MTKINRFRSYAIECHIITEVVVNNFLTRYFLKFCDFDSSFNDLVLINVSFYNKMRMLNQIFNERNYNFGLKDLYSNLIYKNNKVVGIKDIHGKTLMTKELMKDLETINKIRNHLAHNILLDSKILTNLSISKPPKFDMNYKGDRKILRKSFKRIKDFSANLKKRKFQPDNPIVRMNTALLKQNMDY